MIRHFYDQVEYVSVVWYVWLWYCGHNGYMWFHLSEIMNVPSVSKNINTTVQTHDGEVVPVTVSCSCRLLEVDNSWLNSGFCPIFYVIPDTFPKRMVNEIIGRLLI